MRSSVRVLAAVLALGAQAAFAQTVVPPTVTVQQLAPQLVTFAGSPLNFQSLVNGLAAGGPVQLVTVLPNGFSQIVTFTPTAAMAPTDIARVLETARQQLISLGIAAPTAEQIGFTLMGGIVPTALGGAPVNGVLNPQNPPSPAAQLQQRGAASGNTSASPTTPTSLTPAPGVTSGVNVQFIPNAAAPAAGVTPDSSGGIVRRNTSDSPIPSGATSFSPQLVPSNTPPAGADAGGAFAKPPAASAPPAGRRTMN